MIKLDNEFIKRLTSVTSFNLRPSDFTSNKYKNEIQYLFQQHKFGSFDPKMSLGFMDKNKYNKLVNLLKADDKKEYEQLHNIKMSGVGPAEVVLFLLTKDGYIGGGSSTGADLLINSKKYEVKAVKWKSKSKKDTVYDFKLGGNIPGMPQLEVDLQRAFFDAGLTSYVNTPEIKESLFKKFKEDNAEMYLSLEKRYQKLARGYFSQHETIFIQTESNQPDFGEIISIKSVQEEDITMERYTSRSIKPLVRI